MIQNQLRQAAAMIGGDILVIRETLDSLLHDDPRFGAALENLAAGARGLADLAAALERGEEAMPASSGPLEFGDLDGGELLGRGAR